MLIDCNGVATFLVCTLLLPYDRWDRLSDKRKKSKDNIY